MKTDTIFYQIFQNFPSIFFELIGQPTTDISCYQFTSPEVKQQAFRFDGLFLPVAEESELPIYFVEVQFQKKPKFYARLFAEIFLYFYQYDHNKEWYAIVIYRRRSIETPAPRQYRELMEHRVRQIYLDELGETAEQYIGIGIVQLVVESKKKTPQVARNLIEKAQRELADVVTQQQVIELIETVILYKFPKLSREEIEAMLALNELKQTRFYQEALEEGRQEGLEQGREQGKLEAKLEMVSLLLEVGLSLEEIAQRLGLDLETVEAAIQQQPENAPSPESDTNHS
ncbi:Rpn family recombination-promoting nuclease/putative transposase [Allocoleopsis sp.]|uniref:Rpn family recombination-promoting nuclease/putative transposase n=1 Tax=Allocoleopsis sp. TaxID=3088169 RepID=UPI002FD07D37